ncbi:unnamed protein product [Toxocara canis]|uniref:Amiloride-sensitive sodium channel n=1 Tax=Toxocara canis TaxID=6265 RepID=A0A183VGF1_TOXCA|nr:unnamed protein product [Toxocara canis]
MWLQTIADRNVTFEEFTEKVGEETIRRSMQRFQRTTFNEDLVIRTRFRTSWISMMQFCFQPWFDNDNFYNIEEQASYLKFHTGNFFTLMLSHNAANLDGENVECMSVDLHGRPSSLSRFMQGKGRIRDGYNDDLCLGMRHEVTVEVRAQYEMLENDENGTACRNEHEREDTEFECRSRCRMKLIQSMCNCTGLTLSYLVKDDDELKKYPLCDYEQCELDVQRGKFSDEECSRGCLRNCKQIRFEIDHEQQGRMSRKGNTALSKISSLRKYNTAILTVYEHWQYCICKLHCACVAFARMLYSRSCFFDSSN